MSFRPRGLTASPDARVWAVTNSHVSGDGKVGRIGRTTRHSTGVQPASDRGEIRLLDAETGKEVHRLEVDGSEVWALAFSLDGRTLAATSDWEEGEVHFFEVATGRETRKFAGPSLRAPAMAFTPDGSRLITGMADGSVLV